MWLLYSVKKNVNGSYYEQVISRLRPQQSYVIIRKGKYDPTFIATIETEPFPGNEVVDPKSRPVIRLTQVKSKKFEAFVGDRTVATDYFLHDQDLIRLSGNDLQFKIRWEPMVIFKDGPADEDYNDMIEEASYFGFHVTKEWHKNVTHIWISDTPQTEISIYLIRALMQKKYIISKKWIQDIFLQSEDRKFSSEALYNTIQPIVWDKFGPFKKPALLSIDQRRSTLFEDMQFISFEKEQTKRLSHLVTLGKGTMNYYDLTNAYEFDIGHNTIFISPNENDQQNIQRWENFKSKFHEQSGAIREIQEVEIGYAIIYCSTNYMCNPSASLTSLNSDSMNTSYEPTFSNERLDEKPDKPNCSMSVPSSRNKNVIIQEQYESSNHKDRKEKPAISACSIKDISRHGLNEQNATASSSGQDHNSELIEAHENVMSPIAPLSPLDEAEDDEVHLPSLNNIFDDFVGSLKPMPPPKKPASVAKATSSSDISTPHNATKDSVCEPNTTDKAHLPSSSKSGTNTSSKQTSIDHSSKSSTHVTSTDNIAASTASVIHDNTHTTGSVSAKQSSTLFRHKQTASSSHDKNISTLHNSSSIKISPVTPELSDNYSSSSLLDLSKRNTNNPKKLSDKAANHDFSDSILSNRDTRPVKRVISAPESGLPQKRKKTIAQCGIYEEEEAEEPTQPEIQNKQYSQIVFAPLVVNPEPPASTSQRSGSGVNYKTFKKVQQFTNANFMDIITMVSSTQRLEEQRNSHQSSDSSRGTRVEDLPNFDPDIQITFARSAPRY